MQRSVLRPLIVLVVLAVVVFLGVQVFRDSGPGPEEVTTVQEGPASAGQGTTVRETPDVEGPAPGASQDPVTELKREVALPAGIDADFNAGTGNLSGRVVDPERAAVEGARVSLAVGPADIQFSLPGTRRPTGRETATDSDGAYDFEGLPAASNYVVLVSHLDFARAEIAGQVVYENDYTLVPDIVLGHGSRVFGVVKDDLGGLLVGARVELWDQLEANFMREGEKRPWKVTETDETGRYEFTNVHFNACEVAASAPGRASATKMSTTLFADSGDRQIDFVLGPPAEIAGRVEDESGAAVAGAVVECYQIGQAREQGASKARAESDANGAFLLAGLAQGTCTRTARARNYSDKPAGTAESGARDVVIVLERRGAVSGSVVDAATSRPLSKFQLHLHYNRQQTSPAPADHPQPVVTVEPTPTGKLKLVSSADGTWEFDDVDPGSYVMEAEALGYAPCRSLPFQVQRGETTGNVRVVMSKGADIEGTVVTSDGRPVPGALVQLNPNGFVPNPVLAIFSSLPSSIPKREFRTRTDEKGAFALRLVIPGTYQIEVSSPNFSSQAVNDVSAVEGQTTAVGRIALSSGGAIVGRCLDPAGKPFADGKVQASTKNGNTYTVRPNYDGVFEIQNLPPGEYDVTLHPEKVDGAQVNPLLMIVQAQKTKVAVVVREGRSEQIVLQVPPPGQ
ncbi:MAG: carboxypeptidase regulatory-like domain-containing protein [Planctomycetes bacterium]|nr:carboxypeptidase regulatory-like domain-containing protein [Planctomycetota bacterium]